MARGKKGEVLTLEERLQAALVPESEQPYRVPGNWCWVRLGSLGYTNIGLTYKPSDKSETGTIVLRSSNIQDGKIDYSDIVRVNINIPENKMSQKGDILICARNGSRDLVGKTAIIDMDGMSYGAFMAIFKSPYNNLIFYYLNSHYFRHIIDRHIGTTTINQVTQSLIKELPFPLPPLSEQHRIVDRIERLFARLDEAKEKVRVAIDSFELRRSSILNKAFTGELTVQWRTEHGVGLESWEKKEISQVAKEIKAGGDKPDDFTEIADNTHSIPVVANGVTSEGVIGYTVFPKFSGETVTVAGRGTIGFSVYRDYPFFPIVRLIVIVPKDFVKAQYLKYAFDAFPEKGIGSSILQLTVPMIKEKIIPVPKISEQEEIVRILDDLFTKEQQAKEAAEAVLEQIELIKKSILARAFRGQLNTNDSNDESAIELIRKIIERSS